MENTMRVLILVPSLALALLLFACDGPIDTGDGALDDPAVVALALSAESGVVQDGTITEVTEHGGELTDDLTGQRHQFKTGGADVVLEVGDKVFYITITTPRGKELVKNVVKK